MRSKVFIVTLVALSLCVNVATGTRAQVGQIGAPEDVRQKIEEKARQLDLGGAQSTIAESRLVPGGSTGWWQSFERGILYYTPRHGVLLMSHAMNTEAYSRTGRERYTLGFPITNEFRCLTPDPRDRYQRFERGIIYWRAAENRYSIERDVTPPATIGDCSRRSGPTDPVVGEGSRGIATGSVSSASPLTGRLSTAFRNWTARATKFTSSRRPPSSRQTAK